MVVRIFGYKLLTAILVGTGLTQIGEFSFVLVQAAQTAGHIGTEVYNATLAASLITIILNAALVRYVPAWVTHVPWLQRLHSMGLVPPKTESVDAVAIICGFGRVGSAVGAALESFGLSSVPSSNEIPISLGCSTVEILRLCMGTRRMLNFL